jgi:hypothetical protein
MACAVCTVGYALPCQFALIMLSHLAMSQTVATVGMGTLAKRQSEPDDTVKDKNSNTFRSNR